VSSFSRIHPFCVFLAGIGRRGCCQGTPVPLSRICPANSSPGVRRFLLFLPLSPLLQFLLLIRLGPRHTPNDTIPALFRLQQKSAFSSFVFTLFPSGALYPPKKYLLRVHQVNLYLFPLPLLLISMTVLRCPPRFLSCAFKRHFRRENGRLVKNSFPFVGLFLFFPVLLFASFCLAECFLPPVPQAIPPKDPPHF